MTERPEAGGDAGTTWANRLEPEIVWREFAVLAAISRRAKQEGPVRAHVLNRLEKLGLVAKADQAGNVIADVARGWPVQSLTR
jgi:hypothetical protein